jgi:glutathione S-transferase
LGDAAAEEAIALRLKAMRRLMRQVNRWVAGQKAAGADLVQPPWPKMLEQAAIIYGQDYALPEAGQLEMFLAQNATLLSHPEQLIVSLRQYIESF